MPEGGTQAQRISTGPGLPFIFLDFLFELILVLYRDLSNNILLSLDQPFTVCSIPEVPGTLDYDSPPF